MKFPWSPRQFADGARARGRLEGTIQAAIDVGRAIKASHPDLPVIFTLSHLAHLTGIAPNVVRGYVIRRHRVDTYRTFRGNKLDVYRTFRLKKRNKANSSAPTRGYRTICVPEPSLMRLQRWVNQNILSVMRPHRASFAYHCDGGVLKAAQIHCRCRWIIKLDIRDFFDSVTERQVYRVFRSLGYKALLSFELARICTMLRDDNRPDQPTDYGVPAYRTGPEGRLPQGAPTSPALANLVVFHLDERLQTLANAYGWTYTRYADDLAFSTRRRSDRNKARTLVAIIKSELRNFGFDPNDAKTVIVPPGARRVVLGLLVDDVRPRLTRAFRNNLETHLYALTARHIGPENHRRVRKFASLMGMRRHIAGLLAFAHYVEPQYAARCYKKFNAVRWPV